MVFRVKKTATIAGDLIFILVCRYGETDHSEAYVPVIGSTGLPVTATTREAITGVAEGIANRMSGHHTILQS